MSKPDEVLYLDGEHETLLTHLDHMHNETRSQTIARLEAALKVAKAGPAGESPLATRTEVVTREVTVGEPEPKVAAVDKPAAKAKRKKAAKARKAKAAAPVNKQVLPATAAE